MKKYDHIKIEKTIQKEWDTSGLYTTEPHTSKKKPFYVLDMFPYPSGQGLHVGHPRGYIGSDVFARFKRMQGYNVLHPMGFDAFGLPAEQYAIQTGKHPSIITKSSITNFKKQLEKIGLSYDWSREVQTIDPEYYKWTQWVFLQIYESWFDTKKQKARPITELVALFSKEGNTKVNTYAAHSDVSSFSKLQWAHYTSKEKQDILMKYRLAYEGYAEVNWCKDLGTVLANDEVLEKDGKLVSERGDYPVERKSMRQWFMRITAYAERLLSGLDIVDFVSSTKDAQRNWIGKSEGSDIEFKTNINRSIHVFTTRADTLFGVTYVVLSPEHTNIGEFIVQSKNMAEASEYIRLAKERMAQADNETAKEKTGIELKGIYAINPANGEQVPVWIGDYVLASYGTGAVMAVPAHDERDFEFAEKYNLPIKEVIAKKYILDGENAERNDVETLHRKVVDPIIKDKDNNFYLIKENQNHIHFAGGGIEVNETDRDALRREIIEETGFIDFEIKDKITPAIICWGFRHTKNKNQRTIGYAYEVILNSTERINSEVEEGKHELIKVKQNEVLDILTWEHHKYLFARYLIGSSAYVFEGNLINSEEFSGMNSEEAKIKITEKVGGRIVTKYKMRDAIFARQRYWGEPIPLLHDPKTGLIKEVPEKKLPLTLPNVKSYKPTGTGESPLASVKAWKDAGYETNTMPGWAGSSWYFLRYMDPHNKKALVGQKQVGYWKNVDMYIGGTEHNTGHLLYARFWHKFLFDIGVAVTEEPFKALRHQGMIGGADGRKMSKRWGNVVNPDDVIASYGADSLRVFEMFLGPFDGALPWSTEGIIGSRRFIERVWRLADRIDMHNKSTESAEKVLHKTIKKVTDDIALFNFNTAVSSMMICMNEFEKAEVVSVTDYKVFLQILAPFAPYATEALWKACGETTSIHKAPWPKHNPKKLIEDTITIVVQVNGKVRAECSIPLDMSEDEVKKVALSLTQVLPWVQNKEIRRVIYVKNRLINIVV